MVTVSHIFFCQLGVGSSSAFLFGQSAFFWAIPHGSLSFSRQSSCLFQFESPIDPVAWISKDIPYSLLPILSCLSALCALIPCFVGAKFCIWRANHNFLNNHHVSTSSVSTCFNFICFNMFQPVNSTNAKLWSSCHRNLKVVTKRIVELGRSKQYLGSKWIIQGSPRAKNIYIIYAGLSDQFEGAQHCYAQVIWGWISAILLQDTD